MSARASVCVVGMGLAYPGADTPEAFWDLVVSGRTAVREVPPGRWTLPPERVYDPEPGAADKVYSTRGCFVDSDALTVDWRGLRIDRSYVEQLDPAFRVLLYAGQQAWADAGAEEWKRERAGVVIGNLVLPSESSSAIAREILGRTFEEAVLGESSIRRATHLDNRYVAGWPAGVLAKALGLGGGWLTLDAACASSLYAVKMAVDELQAGRLDAVLAGGLSRPDALYTQMGFSQLRALSPSGRCSPFDGKGDGLVVGEGAGLVVLKRTEDAVRDGDRIYGVIRGAGLSNDVGGRLLAPTSEGQLRAMRKAYSEAGWQPKDVQLVECHATGTPVGDAVEVESLKALWGGGGSGRCVIGSVKSNIGHLLTAAGSAALIKALLAMKHQSLPPTANFEAPSSGISFDDSPFEVLTAPRSWAIEEDGTRKAAVSAFGFGGINAHLLIEEHRPRATASIPAARTKPSEDDRVAIVGMACRVGPWTSLRAFQERVLASSDGDAASDYPGAWGVESSRWFRTEKAGPLGQGYFIDALDVPLDAFRIPPAELEDMLPQQLLMLDVAARAWRDAGLGDGEHLDAGAFIGLAFDFNATNFHVRWDIENRVRDWARQRDLALADDELAEWCAELRDAFGPPLTANRTMGALGSVVASRIARELRLGGPSHTISSEDHSGLRAFEAGLRALQTGTVDTALVGAVDFPSDVRAMLTRECDGATSDGACAVVLMREADAIREGRRIYAVVRGAGAASGSKTDRPDGETTLRALTRAYEDAGVKASSIGYLEGAGPRCLDVSTGEGAALDSYFRFASPEDDHRCAVGNARGRTGFAGAASGLISVAKAALCLYQETIPSADDFIDDVGRGENDECNLFAPRHPQYWLRNRVKGPRRAGVTYAGLDGSVAHVVLEGVETEASSVELREPLGAHREGLFVTRGGSVNALLNELSRLRRFVERARCDSMERLAREWWVECCGDDDSARAVAFVARTPGEMLDQIEYARAALEGDPDRELGNEASPPLQSFANDRIFYAPRALRQLGALAFVFPGSGNHYREMGRELFVNWPEILRNQDRDNLYLRSQFQPDRFWDAYPSGRTHHLHKALIFGQVALGTAVSDLVRRFGVQPEACIGYSLGETAGLFALGAWTERDEMLRRIDASNLFTSELAGDYDAVRRKWKLPKQEAVDWVLGVIDRPMKAARLALKNRKMVYPLIANTFQETVVGGDRKAVERLIKKLECQFIPLEGVTSVHCEIVEEVEDEYRNLHLLKTTPPAGVTFYSGAWGKPYDVTRETAADSVLAQAIDGVDFPKTIESAYANGVRVFLEMGPGTSCTRMIRKILDDRPHVARSLCYEGQGAVSLVLRALGQLIAHGYPVDLEPLYGVESMAIGLRAEDATPSRVLTIKVGHPERFEVPMPKREPLARVAPVFAQPVASAPAYSAPKTTGGGIPVSMALVEKARETVAATAAAHEAFLAMSTTITEQMSALIARQMELARHLGGGNGSSARSAERVSDENVVLTRELCLEFARGSIAKVLGAAFAEVDTYPTRVRLPDEPLMLVDRVVELEGEPRSLQSGRVVTEHDVLRGGWYLDNGRLPTCITVEAGQADLFLSGYLGIDFETKGLATYRLLDADVTFHRPLPVEGDVIRYDIRIERFFKHGKTYLFRFNYDATVDGERLLTMREGCAGFFTKDELEAGQGITASERRPQSTGGAPLAETWLPGMVRESYDDGAVDALFDGKLADCFGEGFADIPLDRCIGFPTGKMKLVDRVIDLEPDGGPFGLGAIRAEADIHPDDWFLTCHFVDDQVMPGTLMYECCLHTLRIFLMRMGWLGEAETCAWQPRTGVTSKLKCRGQVLASTKVAGYEVFIKELGYGPEPYAIADAVMYSDGKAIVYITDMSIALTGQTREGLERIWASRNEPVSVPKPAIYTNDQILAFAVGKPSEAFGEPYRIFDEERFIARLPGPPYKFLDRITETKAEAWKLVAGGTVEGQYDVPRDEWYFDANRQAAMPYAVFLEIPLQVCGWFSSYMGSALTSEADLKYRNLGGTATLHRALTRDTGTLTSVVRSTNISVSGGLNIQHFRMEVYDGAGCVFEGDTYFGFFTKEALAQQVGIRNAKRYAPSAEESARAVSCEYPTCAPFPDETFRMVDRIEAYVVDGGPRGLGFVRGSKRVDPAEWFFDAHFYQDPVMPGSLGLEAFIQLLKYGAFERWGLSEGAEFEALRSGCRHEWVYRGQVIPSNQVVTVEAVVTEVDDEARVMTADGVLLVDDLPIYEMKGFEVGVRGS